MLSGREGDHRSRLDHYYQTKREIITHVEDYKKKYLNKMYSVCVSQGSSEPLQIVS